MKELLTAAHWKPTLYNLRHWMWPNAILNALPSDCFRAPWSTLLDRRGSWQQLCEDLFCY